MIHGHGDDLYKTSRSVKANFSTNVWYEADTGPLQELLLKNMDKILHYPEPDAGTFREAVAEYHGLKPENVIVGNGATELFYLVAHAFAGGETRLPIPSFTEYEDACKLYGHQLQFITDVTTEKLLNNAAGLMFICNPNNPDGAIWSLADIRAILEHNPDMTLLVDESFIHFAPEAVSAESLLAEYSNILIVRSMTKSYAIPGLRLGYMLGEPGLIELIRCFKQPWSVNALAIEAGKYLLQYGEGALPDAALLMQRQKRFAAEIAAIPGFRPRLSHTSFFLVETDCDSTQLKQDLLEQHGILIRDASNFRGLDHHYFRINTLTEEKNRLFIKTLSQYGTRY